MIEIGKVGLAATSKGIVAVKGMTVELVSTQKDFVSKCPVRQCADIVDKAASDFIIAHSGSSDFHQTTRSDLVRCSWKQAFGFCLSLSLRNFRTVFI